MGSPQAQSGLRQTASTRCTHSKRNPEVRYHRLTGKHQDIGWLYVAMDDALAVGRNREPPPCSWRSRRPHQRAADDPYPVAPLVILPRHTASRSTGKTLAWPESNNGRI